MRGSAIAASLAVALVAMSAAPLFAQTPAPAKPAQPAPAPAAAQPPAQPAPPAAQPPAQPAPPAAAPAQPPAPFPVGSKIAFFNPQAVFQGSSDGRAAVTRVNALIQKKQTEASDKAKLLQGNQQKLQTSGSVMNEAARTQLEKEIDRQTKEAERFQQDAQAEINELQQEVQNDFVKKLGPIIEQLATEKGLHIVFNAVESGIAWATPGLDLTPEVVKKLDATTAKPAATPKP
jgi:Skp family chaperone for outer membrane proteins